MSTQGESRNFKPEVTSQEQIASQARGARERHERTLYKPDGGRIIVLSEDDDEVMASVIDAKDNRDLVTYTRAQFDALTSQFQSVVPVSTETNKKLPSKVEEVPQDVTEVTSPESTDDKEAKRQAELEGVIAGGLRLGDSFLLKNGDGLMIESTEEVDGQIIARVTQGPFRGTGKTSYQAPVGELVELLREEGAATLPGTERAAEANAALEADKSEPAKAETPVVEALEVPELIEEPKPEEVPEPIVPATPPKIIPVTTPEVTEPKQEEPDQPEEPKETIEPVVTPEESVAAPEESLEDIMDRLAANLAAKPDTQVKANNPNPNALSPERRAELQKLADEGEAARQKLEASDTQQAQKDVHTLQSMQRDLSDKLDAATSESEKRQIQDQIDALDSAISLKIARAAGENLSDERKAELEKLAAEGGVAKETLEKGKKNITPEREAELKDLAAKGQEAKKELAENASLSDERKAELQKLIDEGAAAKTELDGSLTGDEKAKKLAAEAEKHRKEEFERIDGEMETSVEYALYQSALNKYATLKADNDTKGIIGRKKRLEQLTLAEDDLVNAKKVLAFATVERRREAKLYGEDEAKAKQAESDDLFNEIRKIDPDSRARTNDILIGRQENRNRFEKVAMFVGRYFNWGNKFGRNAKNIGTGAALGLTMGLAGVGWPITAAASLGLGALIREGSRRLYQDEVLKTHMDDKGEVIPQFTDEKYNTFLKSITESSSAVKNSSGKMTDKLARDILADSRKVGTEENAKARKKAIWNAGMFTAGMAIGGFGGNMIHDAWMNAHAPVVSAAGPNEGTLPNTRYPDAVPIIDKVPTGHVDLANARFPWNFSANHGGAQNAMNQLQTLADAAKSRGHQVAWYITKNGSRALRVDGNDSTQYVVDVLWGNN